MIVDAVSASPKDCAAIEAVAQHHGAGFTGLWLDAPVETLEKRIALRHADASDATVELIRKSKRYQTGMIAWHRIDASLGPKRVVDSARAVARFTSRY